MDVERLPRLRHLLAQGCPLGAVHKGHAPHDDDGPVQRRIGEEKDGIGLDVGEAGKEADVGAGGLMGGDVIGVGVDGSEAEDVADDDASGVGGGGATGVDVGKGVRDARESTSRSRVRSLTAIMARRMLTIRLTMRPK